MRDQNDTQKVKMNWLEYKKGWKISEQTHNGKTYQEIKESLKKGKCIADYTLLQKLRNKFHKTKDEKYKRFEKFWVFVPNPDLINAKRFVAGFVAYSGWAYLDCRRDPDDRNDSLGVFLVRKK